MANLNYCVLLDVTSGTFFCAADAVLLDTRALTPEELDLLNEGSDSERRDLGEERGTDLEELLRLSTPEASPSGASSL